jgi:DNA (cytosine-5)-methyltransferase 3A
MVAIEKDATDFHQIGYFGSPTSCKVGGQALRVYDSEYKHPTLSTGGGNIVKTAQTTIRKLTPIECERLQSLPDNYTEGIAKTHRYKCLGNAFNVEVIKHILSFIK